MPGVFCQRLLIKGGNAGGNINSGIDGEFNRWESVKPFPLAFQRERAQDLADRLVGPLAATISLWMKGGRHVEFDGKPLH
jgi:hypothetical protein